jgi:hypothetical protein
MLPSHHTVTLSIFGRDCLKIENVEPCVKSTQMIFNYKGVLIRVPSDLALVAAEKPDPFWDWLISKYRNTKYIPLSIHDMIEFEMP